MGSFYAAALASCADEAAVDELGRVMREDGWEQRRAAATALMAIGSPKAQAVLVASPLETGGTQHGPKACIDGPGWSLRM